MQRFRTGLLVGLFAVGLTFLFWKPLWFGGSFIGGDVYYYYLPQKSFFADRLADGEFPLWNNRTGHGYPLIGESQTAAFYPVNLVLYRAFDILTAYHISHLLHYVLAFVFAWMYARTIGLSNVAALFASLIYTYGWFPSRCCLEWAIIGGVYLPLTLWCVERFLQTRFWRYLFLLSTALALQLLAGHFNLAFITQLVLAAYIPLRLWVAGRDLPEKTLRFRGRMQAALAVSIVFGFALAAVQLLPTWELKQRSQRVKAGKEFDPGYGHIPPLYWSQTFLPWLWYSQEIDLDKALQNAKTLSIASGTNKVEAHLYFGLLPFALMAWGFVSHRFGAGGYDRKLRLWAVFGLAGLIYTSGWLIPVTKHLPGFGFFLGPGRYGIVTTLAVALLAGHAFGEVLGRLRLSNRVLLIGFVFVVTAGDLWLVSRFVTYTFMLEKQDTQTHVQSEIRDRLAPFGPGVRLFSPGANLPNVIGVASTPVYLGIGPAAYFDPQLKMPVAEESNDDATHQSATPEQIRWLQRAGVTHVMSFKPLDPRFWPAEQIWQGWDPFLSSALARPYTEPLYLSELKGSRGRVSFEQPHADDTVSIAEYRANQVVLNAESKTGGRLILTDLMYPGWQVAVDGQSAEPILFERMYRAVNLPPGKHTVVWTYRPRSVYWGAAISGVALLLLAALAHVRYWHPRWLQVEVGS